MQAEIRPREYLGAKGRSTYEEDGAYRGDRREGRRAKEPSPEVLRRLRRSSNRCAEGRQRGTDHGLREVLRQGAEGPGRQEPPDGGEDEDSGREGSRFQRGQLPKGGRLRRQASKGPFLPGGSMN